MASVLATYFDSMYELRMIAAEAESILPRFMPLSFEGVLNLIQLHLIVLRENDEGQSGGQRERMTRDRVVKERG